MNRRYAALALAVALVVPGAGVAAASASAGAPAGAAIVKADRKDDSKHGSGHDSESKKKKGKKAKTVVYSGTLTAVDSDGATLTLKVRGGRDKKLRNTGLKLAVPDSAKLTRNGAVVVLSELQVGDRVTVQARQKDKVTTVIRVTARGVKATPEPETTTPEAEPTTPEAEPTTPEAEPTTPEAEPTDDSTPDPSPTA